MLPMLASLRPPWRRMPRILPSTDTLCWETRENEDPNHIHSLLATSGTPTGRPNGCPRHVGSMALHLTLLNLPFSSQKDAPSFSSKRIYRTPSRLSRRCRREEGAAPSYWRARLFETEDAVYATIQQGMTLVVFSPTMGHALAHGVTTHFGMLDSMRRIQASRKCNHQRSLGEVRRSIPECESMPPSRHHRGRGYLHMAILQSQFRGFPNLARYVRSRPSLPTRDYGSGMRTEDTQ